LLVAGLSKFNETNCLEIDKIIKKK